MDIRIVGANLVSLFDVILYLELTIFDIHRVYASVYLTVIFFTFLVTSLVKFVYMSLRFKRESFQG
jgi:hypothetical protein